MTIYNVIATRKDAEFGHLFGILPNPDKILGKNYQRMEILTDLLSDSHVKSCVQSRKAGTLSLDWEILQMEAPDAVFELIKRVFDKLDLRRITSEMLDSWAYGYKPLEVYWEYRDGYITPVDVIGKPPEWFAFDAYNNLLFLKKGELNGTLVPTRKFILIQNEQSYTNPYGDSALSRCYWPVTFKKGGIKFWVRFTERYGSPMLIAEMSGDGTLEATQKVLDLLADVRRGGVASLPAGYTAKIVEAMKTSSVDTYETMIDFFNSEITKSILSTALGLQELGNVGSYAATKSGENSKMQVVASDVKLVEEGYNTLISWIVAYNFGQNVKLPRFNLYAEQEVDKALSERDATLANANIVKFERSYIKAAYNLKDEDFTVPVAQQMPFSDPEASAFDENSNNMTVSVGDSAFSDISNAIDATLKPVFRIIEEGKTFEDVLSGLSKIFPSLSTQDLQDKVKNLLLIGEFVGMLSQNIPK
jgi:phage gp29-like protein